MSLQEQPNPVNATGTAIGGEPTGAASARAIPSFYELVGNAAMASRLSEEGVHFIEEIQRQLNDSSIIVVPVTTDRMEARIFCNTRTKAALTIMFKETYQRTMAKDAPPADCWRYIIPKFKEENPEYPYIMPSVLVTPDDYKKSKQMATYIAGCFKTHAGSTRIADRESFRGAKLSITTSLEAVRNFVAQNSPHAVPARDDYGILVYLNIPTAKKDQTGRTIEEVKPIMAITGYTRFLSPMQTGVGKNVPIATVTDIVSVIPSRFMLALALPLAVDAFVMQGMLYNPYRNFMQKDAPNLGHLFTDAATGQLDSVKDIAKFNQYLQQGFTAPFFGIDITEGRARLIGLDQYVHDLTHAVADLSNFLHTEQNKLDLTQAPATCINPFFNFTGTINENGVKKDSRVVDYLKLIAVSPNVAEYSRFLQQDIRNPEAQLNDIMTIYSPDTVESLYITTSIVFNAPLINAIGAAIRELVVIGYDQPQNTMLNLQPLLAQNTLGNQFTQFAGVNAGSAYSYYNNGNGYNGTSFPYTV